VQFFVSSKGETVVPVSRVGQSRIHMLYIHIYRVNQNRIYTPYMNIYLVISLPRIPYAHHIYMVLANPTYIQYFKQGSHQMYGHIRGTYPVLPNPTCCSCIF